MTLFHFSEEKDIAIFTPRAGAVAAPRAAGMEWLNGPLVWAIDDWHQPMYLFPRDCPRILLWPTPATTAEDRARHWTTRHRMIAYVENGWRERIAATTLYRYALPAGGFQSLKDAGMWVSRLPAIPTEVRTITNLPQMLEDAGVELRAVPDLEPLRPLWSTSLHVSGIRLRNSRPVRGAS